MSKVVLLMSVSLDGFFEGPDHDLDWHMVDDEVHEHFNEELAEMSAFLDGRLTSASSCSASNGPTPRTADARLVR